jgi:D-3-phosphoglycerate dehydrogenase
MKVLLTTTSFQDTPGDHHKLLNDQNWDIDRLRGPVTEEVLLPIIANYDAVICGDDEYTQKVLEAGKKGKLKYISKYGVGLDRVDLDAAKKLNIPVTNCPGVNQVSVAEHVLALLFTFEKNVIPQHQTTQQGSWKRLIGHELQGKKIGIVGMGAVGKELAKKATALGMQVLGFDLYKDEDFLIQYPEIKFTEDLNKVYTTSDYLSLHLPHTPQTEKMINEDVLINKTKDELVLVNTARGLLVDTDALIDALDTNKIRAYLTDVLATEPMEENEKLKGVENVIITPHVGSRTYESVARQGSMAVENLIKMVKN